MVNGGAVGAGATLLPFCDLVLANDQVLYLVASSVLIRFITIQFKLIKFVLCNDVFVGFLPNSVSGIGYRTGILLIVPFPKNNGIAKGEKMIHDIIN